MKKFLSLVLALVVLASFATVVSAKEIAFTLRTCEDYEGNIAKSEFNAGETVYLMLDTNGGYKGISALFSSNDKVFEIAQYEGQDDVSGGNYTGVAVMNPNKMANCFSFTAATPAARPGAMTGAYVGLKIKEDAPSGTYDITCTGVFDPATAGANTYSSNTVSIKVNGAAPAVKTVAKTDYQIVESATTIGDKTTDTQIGAAVGIQFTAPGGVALQNKMIWAVETSEGRKYSKAVDVDFSGITGTVTVAATFHNGIHENSFGVAPVAPLEITGVDAIFTDGAEEYFTNAADAANKKK